MSRPPVSHAPWRAVCTTVLAVALLAGGCDDPPPEEPTPQGVALRMFALAEIEEPSAEALTQWFEPLSGDMARAELLDALDALGEVGEIEVQRIEQLEGMDLVAVELTAPLAAGGQAHYSVQLVANGEGSWVVRWFRGPGVEWPRRPRPRGHGLTTSSPPAE